MDTQTLVSVLTWLIGGLVSALIGSWIWFGKRVVAQLEMLRTNVTDNLHSHDLRISRLEDWRTMVSDPRRIGPNGTAD